MTDPLRMVIRILAHVEATDHPIYIHQSTRLVRVCFKTNTIFIILLK